MYGNRDPTSTTNRGYYAKSSQAGLTAPTAHIHFPHIVFFRSLHGHMSQWELNLF